VEGIINDLPLATPSEATLRAVDDISDTVRSGCESRSFGRVLTLGRRRAGLLCCGCG